MSIQEAIEEFVKKWQDIDSNYMKKYYPNLDSDRTFEITYGRKYAKVVKRGAVEAFIELSTGDIFKSASWQAPALHARGNVYSPQNGIEALNASGMPHVRYLR